MKRKRPPYHEHKFVNGKCYKCSILEADYREWKKLANEVLTTLYN